MKMVHLGLNSSRLLLAQPRRKKALRPTRRAPHEVSSIRCRRRRRIFQHVLGATSEACGRRVRGSEKGPQRSGRQTPGVDCQMSWRGRRGRCRQPHAQARPRSGGSWWRSQRGRTRDHRWRVGDRPGADEAVRYERRVASPGPSSIARPNCTVWRSRAGLFQAQESLGLPWVVGWAG